MLKMRPEYSDLQDVLVATLTGVEDDAFCDPRSDHKASVVEAETTPALTISFNK